MVSEFLILFRLTLVIFFSFFLSGMSSPPLRVGGPAPSFELKTLKGKIFKSSDLKNKAVILNFWATWCAPCIKEMPSLDRLKLKIDGNFDVIAISLDRDGVKKVNDFFNENKITNLEKFFDIKNSLAKEMNLLGVPTSFFVNKEGDLIGYYQGDMEWDNDVVLEFINYLIKI